MWILEYDPNPLKIHRPFHKIETRKTIVSNHQATMMSLRFFAVATTLALLLLLLPGAVVVVMAATDEEVACFDCAKKCGQVCGEECKTAYAACADVATAAATATTDAGMEASPDDECTACLFTDLAQTCEQECADAFLSETGSATPENDCAKCLAQADRNDSAPQCDDVCETAFLMSSDSGAGNVCASPIAAAAAAAAASVVGLLLV